MAYDRPVRFACAQCAALPMSDFCALAGPEAVVLDRVKVRRRLVPGEALFRQGDPYTALYCVAEGLLGRRLLHENGAGVLAGIVQPGDILGACGLLAGEVHATTAEALTDCAVCVVQGTDAARLATAEPAFRQRLIARCVAALGAAERALLEAAALPAYARLCRLLATLLDPTGRETARVEVDLPISRTDLAALLGIQPESLSRLLKRAGEEGLIETHGRRVVAPCPARLRAAAVSARRAGEA